jgi:hypothetical protein
MPPRKKPTKDISDKKPEMSSSKSSRNRLQISVAVPSLSGMDASMAESVMSEVKNNILNSINDAELQRSLDKWIKQNHTDVNIDERDYHLLKSVVTEYLDCFILFGYNTQGERIIIQHANNARDRDAVLEFLKTIFIQQQQTNFLELEDPNIDEEDDLD